MTTKNSVNVVNAKFERGESFKYNRSEEEGGTKEEEGTFERCQMLLS
jgi:hypothetical protein